MDLTLTKYKGKDVNLYAMSQNYTKKFSGKYLGRNQGYMVQVNNGIQVYNQVQKIQFPNLYEGLLTFKIGSQIDQNILGEIKYKVDNISWSASYSIFLSQNRKKVDFRGWVTIINKSGKDYDITDLKLIAGYYNISKDASGIKIIPSSLNKKSFDGYYSYDIQKPVSIKDTNQVQLFRKIFDVKFDRQHQIKVNLTKNSQQISVANVFIEINNTIANKLGIPLPKGTLRVYQQDKLDESLMLLKDTINTVDHVFNNAKIKVHIGKNQDIQCNKTTTHDVKTNKYNIKLNLNNRSAKQENFTFVLPNNQEIIKQNTIFCKIINEEYRCRISLKPYQQWIFLWNELSLK